MVCLEEDKTSCIVIDRTPGSTQKRYSIVVRKNCTVKKILKNIETQFQYDSFEVVLEPPDHGEQIFLNDKQDKNLYEIPGFIPGTKNILILSPSGAWLNEPIKKKIDDTKKTIKMSGKITKTTKSQITKSPTPEKSKKIITPEKSISPLTIPNLIPILTPPSSSSTSTTSTAIKNLSAISPDPMSDDDLILGASASPIESNLTTNSIPIPPALPIFKPTDSMIGIASSSNNSSTTTQQAIGGPSASSLVSSYGRQKYYSTPRPISGYVGLVNQAMTCYLNSLLQALFMTPEFRNALYKREFDNNKEDKIPYQLQKLFLNLQTSTKAAVETTDLTKSFGWDSTEAWQQHDIQELCRVMFDALEHKFKNTEQANLINNLYMGKMIDYVKCLECKTEKSREDSFLDIPLPVRPFGSSAAYGSIEEALRAFVQPETLDDNNQYFCEKCNKKCDAHKGLKFKNFPYILTLHLKRFDFDYQTLHRIKLNDKVTFPQFLNLNSFINANESGIFSNLQTNNNINTIIGHTNGFVENGKFDDCSTTDSGAAMEEDNCSGIATTASSSQHESELQEDDEGIDLSANPDHRSTLLNENGPFHYELFSIMIHSGSASGGHYYAYIKEFETNEWYCFNDQTVTSVTQEDIQKSFGGGSAKAYYSGVYSSSTNAYMLMYRQIDTKRNEHAIKSENFPEHIKKLFERLGSDEETKRSNRHSDSDILKPKVYFYNPKLKQLKDSKVYISRDFGLESCLESAYASLKVQPFAPMSRCRLVAYDHILNEEIHCSLEGREQEEIGDIINSLPQGIEFLLETRQPEEEFEKYEINGVTLKVFLVDLNTKQLDGPYLIRAYESQKIEGLKNVIAKKLKINTQDFIVQISNFNTGGKVFVAYCGEKSTTTPETTALNLKEIINEHFSRFTYFYITIPTVEKQNLEILGIPPYEEQQQRLQTNNSNKKLISPTIAPHQSPTHFDDGGGDVVDAVMMNGSEMNYSHNDYNSHSSSFGYTSSGRCSPPLISISHSSGSGGGGGGGGGNNSTGSNSEDSSLSDGDRTLVEETHQNDSNSQISSPSHSPQLSSPEDGNIKQGCRPMLAEDITSDDDDDIMEIDPNLYFYAVQMPTDEYDDTTNSTLLHGNSNSISDNEDSPKLIAEKLNKILKVFVDERTKIGSLKRALEPHVTVPAEYFKIIRKQSDQLKLDTANANENVTVFKEGEQLKVDLGRNPKKGERKAKIHFLRSRDLNNETGKLPIVCEWIFKLGLTVIEAKRQLVSQFHRIDIKEYETLRLENCRLWEKNGRNPYKILPDDHKLGSDMRLSINCEFIIQECENGACTSTNEESLTLFVRRWHPNTLELDYFEEITLEKDEEIKKKLSTISGIPEDNISYTQVNSTFPCTNISILTINSSMSWHTNTATCENYPISSSHSGNVYFYKNSTESPKELTPDERKELSNKEKARLERIGGGTTTSLYSPRRERALKIYLDSPPKSNRDE